MVPNSFCFVAKNVNCEFQQDKSVVDHTVVVKYTRTQKKISLTQIKTVVLDVAAFLTPLDLKSSNKSMEESELQ